MREGNRGAEDTGKARIVRDGLGEGVVILVEESAIERCEKWQRAVLWRDLQCKGCDGCNGFKARVLFADGEAGALEGGAQESMVVVVCVWVCVCVCVCSCRWVDRCSGEKGDERIWIVS
jgi:hypothetical protein